MGKTLNLSVDDNKEWESPLVTPEVITESSLLGKLKTKRAWNKKLIKTVLGRVWC